MEKEEAEKEISITYLRLPYESFEEAGEIAREILNYCSFRKADWSF